MVVEVVVREVIVVAAAETPERRGVAEMARTAGERGVTAVETTAEAATSVEATVKAATSVGATTAAAESRSGGRREGSNAESGNGRQGT